MLGAGDASKPYQGFTLRQPPLTFVRNDTSPTGAASTLALRVNDLRWDEVPFFYGRGPTERVYTTRLDDDGTTVVQFGDGIHGARLPTGPGERARHVPQGRRARPATCRPDSSRPCSPARSG